MNALGYPPLPIVILLFVFAGISIRKIGRLQLPIWLIMTLAALAVLVTRQITVPEAIRSINADVILYLLGVFIIGQAFEESNYLEHLLLTILQTFTGIKWLLGLLIFFSAIISMLLMNDTAAIIATPALILLHQRFRLPLIPLLLTLAYTITVSSIASPIGNPQNLLIAMKLDNPFVLFPQHLLIPTLLGLVILYFYIWFCFRRQFQQPVQEDIHNLDVDVDSRLARLAKLSMTIMLLLIGYDILNALLAFAVAIPFSAIALISASPIVLLSPRRFTLIRHIDWHTIVFFIALFIFMESVWLSGYFQAIVEQSHIQVTSKSTIVWLSLLLSQLISNVPLVALYLPLLAQTTTQHYLLLAMASTIAGNLLILGAASNIIIIQNAEKRGVKAFGFWQFLIYGIPVTLLQIMVYFLFLTSW
ncbi:SLC13 family permease [Legionella spiritensis]|uniref:Arsenite efflux membrane component-like protein n=1 Tax=Legionella spiritensis TaxID=452 RepID=A0A0W0YYJ0_LEGSP|nr:SLC13 family permease [Legionella spiritensis]KTD61711.1 arsenite efflux membrane component-like protein [Legionella spiritensis]SNV38818.1 NaH antiporter NhaD [Legionella spiritensis]